MEWQGHRFLVVVGGKGGAAATNLLDFEVRDTGIVPGALCQL